MYNSVTDPYCYTGSTVLRNIPNLRSQSALDRFEALATGRRFLEPLPVGRLSVRHYVAVHRHIFQDVYAWAGRFRTVRISRGDSVFCYPENIAGETRRTFYELRQARFFAGLELTAFAGAAAHFLADLNAIHPFRDGNGRAQLAFLAVLADGAGHPLDLARRLNPVTFLEAMIASFQGEEMLLAEQIIDLARRRGDG